MLPASQLWRQTVAIAVVEQQRVLTGRLEGAVVGALLLLAVDGNLLPCPCSSTIRRGTGPKSTTYFSARSTRPPLLSKAYTWTTASLPYVSGGFNWPVRHRGLFLGRMRKPLPVKNR